MLKFTKLFAGSYKAEYRGITVYIESMAQYTTEVDIDENGNKWVLTIASDYEGTYTTRAVTKKALVQEANNLKDTYAEDKDLQPSKMETLLANY